MTQDQGGVTAPRLTFMQWLDARLEDYGGMLDEVAYVEIESRLGKAAAPTPSAVHFKLVEIQSWCQCEHKDHFTDGETEPVGHSYGDACETVAVETAYGPFQMCKACVDAGHGRMANG